MRRIYYKENEQILPETPNITSTGKTETPETDVKEAIEKLKNRK